MEPSANQPANFELPPPQNVDGQAPNGPERAPAAPERKLDGSDQPATSAPPAPAQPMAPPVDPASLATPGQPVPAQPVGSATPAVASDSDLIEKEWVEKAKDIVEKTRSDPHAQNKEINKFKAEYMKKRYNKDIKVTNE